jgi:mycothiol synthase
LTVSDLVNLVEVANTGAPGVTSADLDRTWSAPGFDLDADAVVAEAEDGRLVGYGELRHAGEAEPSFDGYVDPSFRGRGVGSEVVGWGEMRALEAAGPQGPILLRHFVYASETDSRRLFETRGYEIARRHYFMIIELDADIPEPHIPDGIELRTFRVGVDERALYEADMEAFADHWGFTPDPFDYYRHHVFERADFDPEMVLIAWDGDEIAAGLFGQTVRVEDPKKGWVGMLFTRRRWRRRGLGRALLLRSFADFRARGYERVGLGVDATNPTGAVDLYVKAGMRVEREILCYQRILRSD